jgi:hypothetical protein
VKKRTPVLMLRKKGKRRFFSSRNPNSNNFSAGTPVDEVEFAFTVKKDYNTANSNDDNKNSVLTNIVTVKIVISIILPTIMERAIVIIIMVNSYQLPEERALKVIIRGVFISRIGLRRI